MRTVFTSLSRMLLKGDEGGAKFRKRRFSPGGHYPWVILALRVIGIVPLPLIDSPLSESPTLANAAWENQKRPSARSVSPARVVQIERTTTPHPKSALTRSSHFGRPLWRVWLQ